MKDWDFQVLNPLIDVLAFYTALRNYGFVDRLSNALNEVAVYEALNDLLRAYSSQCLDSENKCVEVGGARYRCPQHGAEDLEKAIKEFMKRIEDAQSDVIVKNTRELALAAHARKPKMLESKC